MATATTVMEPNVKINATKLLINGQWVNSVSGKDVSHHQSLHRRSRSRKSRKPMRPMSTKP